MQQIPEEVFLAEHEPARVVDPQPPLKPERFRLDRFSLVQRRVERRGRLLCGATARGVFSRGEVLRSAEVGHDFAGERVERFDSLCPIEWASGGSQQKEARLIAMPRFCNKKTHRKWRIVVPRRVMQRPPQQRRSVLCPTALLAPEGPRRQLDGRARFSLPSHFTFE